MALSETLKISEIFYSLQGESLTVGIPTLFIRLTGCPLRCSYCDTEYAFSGGERMTIDDILKCAENHKASYVTVTGGEPLAQNRCLDLLHNLCDAGYRVSLETGGAHDISEVDPRVTIVMDIKTPASGEVERNRYANIPQLRAKDQIKFVICDRKDYDWAKSCLDEYALNQRCNVLFSPAWQSQNAGELAEWILKDHLSVRMQLQLHKILWGETRGR
ncbi:MAG: 7-carboxy-7-deazaguanine synthase QueE [Gammaproteobacteria bacterium]|nr:7-carboxy-7-deazaguanine synthase QueE [Gammaproteobacteria bacterium]